MSETEHIVQIADNSVAIGMGAKETMRGEVLFQTSRGAALSLRLGDEILINGISIGRDHDLYIAFHEQFGVPFELGCVSSNPFLWKTRADEQRERLQTFVLVLKIRDLIIVGSGFTEEKFHGHRLEDGDIFFRNIAGIEFRIRASGEVICGDAGQVTVPGTPAGNATIKGWLKALLFMDERSM